MDVRKKLKEKILKVKQEKFYLSNPSYGVIGKSLSKEELRPSTARSSSRESTYSQQRLQGICYKCFVVLSNADTIFRGNHVHPAFHRMVQKQEANLPGV